MFIYVNYTTVWNNTIDVLVEKNQFNLLHYLTYV